MMLKHRQFNYPKIITWLLLLFVMACQTPIQPKEKQTEKLEQTIYYCPMHSDVQQNHPGKCPKPECAGMELVVKEPEEFLKTVLKPVSSSVLAKVCILKPIYKKLPVYVESLGVIDYDNYSKFDISSLYNGRIDKLYIRYNYQPIRKGEVLFEVYNADIVNAEENLLFLLKSANPDKELIAVARQKLKSMQLTQEQINELESTKKIKNSIPVYSKYDGHIHEMLDSKMAQPEMNDYSKSPLISIKEGMYIQSGQALFNVVNANNVVVILKIKANDIGKIHAGEKVSCIVNDDTNMVMQGKIDFVEPLFNSNSKTMNVRVNLNNQLHKHKIGSLVKAKVIADSLETLWVPLSAIVDLGKEKIVWKWEKNYFRAVKVETGIKINQWIEIADGLTENDQIASEAHYLSDSEGFIKINENE